VIKRQSISKSFTSPITKVVVAMFLWNIFIGILSYLKGFDLQNVLRQLSRESLMFIAILVPQIEDIDIKKEHFFKYLSILCVILVMFIMWRLGVTHEVQLTSSGTLRGISGNAVPIFMIPMCCILFYSNYRSKHKLFSCAIIALLTIGIISAGHRSGLVALLFIIVMRYFFSEHYKLDILFVPSFAVALLMTAMLILPMIHITAGKSFLGDLVLRFNDTFNFENSTTQERLSKWKYSVEIMKESPLLGLGRFPVYTLSLGESNTNLESFVELNRPVHNIFAKKLLHEGLWGLSIISIFFYIIFKQLKKISPLDKRYARFLLVYILSFTLFSMFNTTFSNASGRTCFFIMIGFLNAEVLKNLLLTGNHKCYVIPATTSWTKKAATTS
jgi:hypothetical protein